MDALLAPPTAVAQPSITQSLQPPRIVVFATERVDRTRAALLFAGVDCKLTFSDDLAIVESRINLTKPDFDMAFVFHRHSSAWPQAPVPAHRHPCRIAVLSDTQSETAVVSALDSGATHYFDLNDSDTILKARVRACLRRFQPIASEFLVVPPFRFRLRTREVFRWDEAVSLRPKEYDLATFIFKNPHRLITNAELLSAIWSLPHMTDTRRIDTAACRLRKRLPLNSESGWQLRRIRKKGYRLERIGRI